MGEQNIAKSFKSGNSVAVRLPAGLGIRPGKSFRIVQHDDGSMTIWPEDRAKEAFMALAGAMSPGWMADGRLPSDEELSADGDTPDFGG